MTAKGEIEALLGVGRHDEAIARCLELARGVERGSEIEARREVFAALLACTDALFRLGHNRDALRATEEIRARFSDDPDLNLRAAVVSVLGRIETAIWLSLEQPERAIESLDMAWAMAASSDRILQSGVGVVVLVNKATVLHSLGRSDEAVVVVDSSMGAIADATLASEADRSKQALKAVLFKLENLLALDRGEEPPALAQQLADLLDTFSSEVAVVEDHEDVPGSEVELARVAAECVNGEAWSELESAAQNLTVEARRERAIGLYRVSEPWAVSAATGATSSADAAAELVRNFADGYAMLSVGLSPGETARLPLPQRAEAQAHLSPFGVQNWAREQGHPLELPVPPTDPDRAGRPVHGLEASEEEYFDGRFVRDILMLTYFYEFLTVFERFATGREAMRSETMQRMSKYLPIAKQAATRLILVGEDGGRTGAAIVGLLIARDVFIASHDHQDAEPIPLFPAGHLRRILHDTGGHDWLTDHHAPLPSWTDSG